MTDTIEVEKWRPVHGGDAWVRVTDYDALAAKLADAERVARYESDIAQQALDQMKAEKARAEAAEQRVATLEAALPAVYRLALEDAYWSREVTPTPTAAELMARIQTGEKE